MTDKEFLFWLANRIVFVYDENPDVDCVRRLVSIAKATPEAQKTPNTETWDARMILL